MTIRREIDLPDPCLVVLVGPAGSGKSTLAGRHFGRSEILASDAFRARIGAGEADQAVSRTAFTVLHAALARRLARGLLTVVDATSVTIRARRSLLERARAARLPAVAVVLALPVEDCLASDAGRPGRHVPPDVIRAQWRAMEESLAVPGRLIAEGFAAVHVLGSRAEIDALTIGRSPVELSRQRRDAARPRNP